MVCYSVCTTYHLLEAIVHKCIYNKEKSATLFISGWLANKYSWYKNLKVFFEKIIVFNGHYEVNDRVKENLDNYYNELFLQNDICLGEYEELHVLGAEHSFGAYIALNQIPYIFWEEGAGALGKGEEMRSHFEKHHGKIKSEFQRKHCLENGLSTFVEKRYYNKYFQENTINGEKLYHFDIAEELGQMDIELRNKIVDLFFGKEKIELDANTIVLLTEALANNSVMSWNEQIVLYQYIKDYFLKDFQIFIKPHPDDLMYYEELFSDIKIERQKFPAELLPYIFKALPEGIATVSSTSIYGFRNIFDKVLEFNFEFSHRKQFYYLNQYYIALSIAKQYISEGWKLNLVGVNTCIIDNFAKFDDVCIKDYNKLETIELLDKQREEKKLWIIDDVKEPHENADLICSFMDRLSSDDIVLFINSNRQYCFYGYKYRFLWENIEPVSIYVKRIEAESVVSFGGPTIIENTEEVIYFYSKMEKLRMESIKRILPNVGITITTEKYDGDKKKIKLLEGMLEATEKRLLYYIEKEENEEAN